MNEILEILKKRFEQNERRHEGLEWQEVENRLLENPDKLEILKKMEESGGEPDVVGRDKDSNEFLFFDCVKESPDGRRSLCFDQDALESRKNAKPKNSALGMAKEIGVEILNEEQYRLLQTLGDFDLKTSSWIATPNEIRKLGGALFCDKRYNKVFTYHNGAESYYASRGFRGVLKV